MTNPSKPNPEYAIALQHIDWLRTWTNSLGDTLPPTDLMTIRQAFNEAHELISRFSGKPESETPDIETPPGTDGVTGVFDKEVVLVEGRLAFDRSRAECQAMVLLVVEIDKFSRVGDDYGNLTSEAILKMVVRIIRRKLRKTDIVGRYEDGAFIIVLPGCPLSRAGALSEELCQAMSESAEPKSGLHVTVSIGVAAPASETNSLDMLLEQTLQALRLAQSGGGNRVSVSR